MKTPSLYRVAFLVLVLATGGMTATYAQTPTPSATTATAPLTPEEKAQLKKDRDAVLAADPALKTEDDSIKEEGKTLHSSGTATPEEKQAFGEKRKAHMDKIHAAMVKLNPADEPLIAKMQAAMKGHHHKE